jgi:hypothetical protein
VTATTYQHNDCAGGVVSSVVEPVVGCQFVNGSFFGLYCDVEDVPVMNVSLRRISCPGGCGEGSGSGSSCSTTAFETGVCSVTNQPDGGAYAIAWCFPDFVVYNYYLTDDCSGPVYYSVSEPAGSGQCFPSADQLSSIENICGHSA